MAFVVQMGAIHMRKQSGVLARTTAAGDVQQTRNKSDSSGGVDNQVRWLWKKVACRLEARRVQSHAVAAVAPLERCRRFDHARACSASRAEQSVIKPVAGCVVS